MPKINIVVIDDHPLFRQGVVDTLSLEPDITVVGQAADGVAGLEMIRTLQPNVAVIDVNMPGMNGQQITRQVVAEKLETRVVLLTGYDDTEQHMHALRVGAAAYCTKDMEPEALVQVIRLIVAGNIEDDDLIPLPESTTEPLPYNYGDLVDPYQPLSQREMEVLIQVTKGQSNKEIAVTLGISHQTVKNHVTAILRKLGVEDRTQAAIYALRRGWVRLHEGEQAS